MRQITKSGVINSKQRYLCKNATTFLPLTKSGKKMERLHYLPRRLQLLIPGLSYREIRHNQILKHAHQQWVR
jgi:hypothetical protein